MEPDFSSWYRRGSELNAKCTDATLGAERWVLVHYGNTLGADRFSIHARLAGKLACPLDPDPLNVWLRRLAKEHGTPGELFLHCIHEKSIVTLERLRANVDESTGKPAAGRNGAPRGQCVDGKHLKALRGTLSQDALAEAAGVSVDTIQRGERSERWSDDSLTRVAGALTSALGRPVDAADLLQN